MRWLVLIAGIGFASSALAETPVERARRAAEIPGATCADIALLRGHLELETDEQAAEVLRDSVERRVAAALTPVESLLVLASVEPRLDMQRLERIRRALVYLRCVDSARVDRDLAFLARVRALRTSGLD